MSLLWPDARIAILPDRVAIAAGRTVTELPVATDRPDGLMHTLAEAIEASRCKGRADVVLSHALAPVWLLPAPELRLDWRETRGWARDQLAGQLGDRIGQCRLAFQPAPPGTPVLVSVLDEQWLSGLSTTLIGRGIKPRRLQPWLAEAVNRRWPRLRRGTNWLALAEPGRLTLACYERGLPRVVRSLQVAGEMAAALPDAVRREALLAGLSDSVPVWLEACGVEADWQGRAGRCDVRPLASGPADAMALIRN